MKLKSLEMLPKLKGSMELGDSVKFGDSVEVEEGWVEAGASAIQLAGSSKKSSKSRGPDGVAAFETAAAASCSFRDLIVAVISCILTCIIFICFSIISFSARVSSKSWRAEVATRSAVSSFFCISERACWCFSSDSDSKSLVIWTILSVHRSINVLSYIEYLPADPLTRLAPLQLVPKHGLDNQRSTPW